MKSMQRSCIRLGTRRSNAASACSAVAVDNNYTFDSANPIVDGRDRDLRHAKVIDPTDPFHHEPVTPNKNWKQPTIVQNPTTVRFGLQGRF